LKGAAGHVAKSFTHLTARKLAVATASDVTSDITRRDLCKYFTPFLRFVADVLATTLGSQTTPDIPHTTQLNPAKRQSLVSKRRLKRENFQQYTLII
jgi:hypothetical protein